MNLEPPTGKVRYHGRYLEFTSLEAARGVAARGSELAGHRSGRRLPPGGNSRGAADRTTSEPKPATALLERAELVHKDPEFEVIDVPQIPLPYKKGLTSHR